MSPENLVGYGEQPKASAITKCFEDAYKSPMCAPLFVFWEVEGFGGLGGRRLGRGVLRRLRCTRRYAPPSTLKILQTP